MRLLRRALALALAYSLSVHPVVAQVQSVRLAALPAAAPGAAAVSATGSAFTGTLRLQALALPLAASFAAPSAPALATPAAAVSVAAAAPLAAVAVAQVAPRAAGVSPAERLPRLRAAADAAVKDIDRASGDEASLRATAQFAALTSEPQSPSSGSSFIAPRPSRVSAEVPASVTLEPASAPAPAAAPKAVEPPPAKLGPLQAFHDPVRNNAFWRYFLGSSIFLFGYEMFSVAKPYLVSAWTTNSLSEHKDFRASSTESVGEIIRSQRALSSIAPGLAQAFGYFLMPVFSEDARKEGPKKWLVRSTMIFAVLMAAVPGLFCATGVISVQASIGLLFGLFAAQAFFLSVSETTESRATTNLFGDKSVTDEERTKANLILTVAGSVIAVLGRLAAGMIARIGPVMRKTGAGGAVICAIFSGAAALAGLIFATIRIFGAQNPTVEAVGESVPASPVMTVFGKFKMLCRSILDGTRIVIKDRLLRMMLILSMLNAVVEDLLTSNVLPEFVEHLAATSPGAVAAFAHVPGLGWLIKTLTTTMLGNFSMMMVMGSFGVIAAALLLKPMTALFHKLGFKTEESLTIPFYFIAALEFPLFLLMMHAPTLLAAVALYGLQSLVTGFIGIKVSGLRQQNLGAQKDGDVNKILAATSLFGIGVSSLSAYWYGFHLQGITIAAAMHMAAFVVGAVALARLFAPFVSFAWAKMFPPKAAPGAATPSGRPAEIRPADLSRPNSTRALRY